MSIESTQERSANEPDNASSGEDRSVIDPTTSKKTNGEPTQTLASTTGGASAVAVGANPTHSPAMDLPVKPMRNLPQWLLFNLVCPLLLLAVAGGIVWKLGTVQSPARPPIDDTKAGRLFALPAVDVVPVRSLESTGQKLQLKTDGTVVPFREIILATEVAGQIIEKSVKCEAGKFVKKGDVLMTIDPTDYELEVKRLQRLQQQEYESLGELDQEMANTEKSKELALADIQLQERELKRRQSLPDQFASQGEVDQARRALLQAEQSLLLLQNQLELAKKRRIRQQSAEQLAKMQLEAAENNLKRTTIQAPMDGVIVSEQAELNTFVARGSPVVTMEDTSKVEVAASLRTDQLYWVLNQRRADDVVLSKPDGTEVRGYQLPPTPVRVEYKLSGREDLVYQWRGQLTGYDGIGLDEQTRTVPVRIVVDRPQQFVVKRNGEVIGTHDGPENGAAIAGPTTLVRGMFVNLSLELTPAMELVVLPSESLKPGNRVWQFLPDASVLDQSLNIQAVLDQPGVAEKIMNSDGPIKIELPVEPSAETNGDPAEDAAASQEVFATKGFDPEKWVPGQLSIIADVRPIDRFVDDRESSSELSKTEHWICEVTRASGDDSGTSITDGSYVIVSPLGSLQSDIIPVRASSEIVQVAGESK